MRTRKGPGSLNQQIRNDAAGWFVAFCENEADGDMRRQFNAWLRQSPEHVRAYLRISVFWEDAEDLKKHARQGIDEMLRQVMAEPHVIEFGPSIARRHFALDTKKYRARFVSGSIAACLLCASLLVWFLIQREPVYTTSAGEQRTITLADGSTMQLNARSRVRVRYSDALRQIDLLSGQALFKVAKNPSRPFLVYSDDMSVRAVGTQFDVYRRHGSTVVTVIEGQVAVSGRSTVTNGLPSAAHHDSAGSSETVAPRSLPVTVSAGQLVVASPHEVSAPESANTSIATAWTEGKLVFDSEPLKDVLEEFNRYLPRPLIVEDPHLLSMHISGVFSVTESQQFIAFLHQRFGTTSHETEHEVRLTRP